MAKNKPAGYKGHPTNPFERLSEEEINRLKKGKSHVFGKNVRCNTDVMGFPTPHNRSPLEIVVDATEGFIPLWEEDTTLRWRFQEQSLIDYANPTAVKSAIRNLLGKALLAWGTSAPVKFAEKTDAWDFEITVRESDDCDINGCVLASAFFPDAGRHELTIYPKMFEETAKEQVDTLTHEIGHVFGLRHFFAQITETQWKSEIFGKHNPFSIMNYGAKSQLTKYDKSDLKRLYQLVWSGQLTQINGTPVKLMRPFHQV